MSLERRKLSGDERRASSHSPATEHGDADNGCGRQTLSMVASRPPRSTTKVSFRPVYFPQMSREGPEECMVTLMDLGPLTF